MKNKLFNFTRLFSTLFSSITLFAICFLLFTDVYAAKPKSKTENKESNKEASKASNPIFWEIKNDKTTIYLLGSVHLGRSDMYPLPKHIEKAFEKSDYLGLEINVENVNPFEIMNLLTYKGDTVLADMISKENYDQLVAIFKQAGLPEIGFSKLKPFAAAMTAEQMQYKSIGMGQESGIDFYFLNKAKKAKKEIIELESIAFQMSVFSEFDKISDPYIKYTLSKSPENDADHDIVELIEAWKSGDEDKIVKIINKTPDDFPQLKTLMEKLLDDRNITMSAKIQEYLQKGGTYFVVVGAAHIVGEKGIVDILKKDNKLKIQRISSTETK